MAVVVAGEALIDLAPREGLLLPLPGGSPYNVAVGLARLEVTTSYLGGLSTDGLGHGLATRLVDDGVDLALVPRVAAPTTLAVVHLDEAGRASYGFYLDGTAATTVRADELPSLPDGAALHVSLGAIGLAHDPTGQALAALVRREHPNRRTSLDPNVRPLVFDQAGGVATYAALLDDLLPAIDVVKVSDEDLAALAPDLADPLDLARRWAGAGPALVVVTRGADGAVAVRGDTEVAVPGIDVEVVDTVGAGDAFSSGLLAWFDDHGLDDAASVATLDDAALDAALRQAARVAAFTCTRAGADPPHRDELDGLDDGQPSRTADSRRAPGSSSA